MSSLSHEHMSSFDMSCLDMRCLESYFSTGHCRGCHRVCPTDCPAEYKYREAQAARQQQERERREETGERRENVCLSLSQRGRMYACMYCMSRFLLFARVYAYMITRKYTWYILDRKTKRPGLNSVFWWVSRIYHSASSSPALAARLYMPAPRIRYVSAHMRYISARMRCVCRRMAEVLCFTLLSALLQLTSSSRKHKLL